MRVKINELKKSLSMSAMKPPSEAMATSARAAVEAVREEIDLLLRKGFSYKEISEILNANAVKISTASLQTYMRGTIKKTEDRKEAPPPNFESHPLYEVENDQRI